MKTAILLPAYNEENTIRSVLVESLNRKIDSIIIVLDNPLDNTSRIVKDIAKENPKRIVVLEHAYNKGLTAAMKTGFSYALNNGFDIVIKYDSDGQMNSERTEDLLALYSRMHPDLILATYDADTPRMIKNDMLLYGFLFYCATGEWFRDLLSEFRLYSRKSMFQFLNARITSMGSNVAVINLWGAGCSITEISGGVNYHTEKIRPAHINMLLDIRVQFVRSVWNLPGVRAKIGACFAAPILAIHLLFNLILGANYNSFLSKALER